MSSLRPISLCRLALRFQARSCEPINAIRSRYFFGGPPSDSIILFVNFNASQDNLSVTRNILEQVAATHPPFELRFSSPILYPNGEHPFTRDSDPRTVKYGLVSEDLNQLLPNIRRALGNVEVLRPSTTVEKEEQHLLQVTKHISGFITHPRSVKHSHRSPDFVALLRGLDRELENVRTSTFYNLEKEAASKHLYPFIPLHDIPQPRGDKSLTLNIARGISKDVAKDLVEELKPIANDLGVLKAEGFELVQERSLAEKRANILPPKVFIPFLGKK